MRTLLLLLLSVFILASCKTTTYYVVRHAEKADNTTPGDVPLSEAGTRRAEALKDLLQHKNIGTIYATNFQRTRLTAQPLANAVGRTIQVYNALDSTFVPRIVNIGNQDKDGNILIVGHSNTVDDIVNTLVGHTVVEHDLADTQYGDLYVVKQKGKKFTVQHRHFGE